MTVESLREEKKREVEDLAGCQFSGEFPDNCVMRVPFTGMLSTGEKTMWTRRGGWEERDGLHFDHVIPMVRCLESPGYGGWETAQGWRKRCGGLSVKFNSGRKPSTSWTVKRYVQ